MTPEERAERHLLVVDDDDRIRTLLKEFLTRAGFRVSAAADAAHADRLTGAMAVSYTHLTLPTNREV